MYLKDSKIIVIKIGSSLLIDDKKKVRRQKKSKGDQKKVNLLLEPPSLKRTLELSKPAFVEVWPLRGTTAHMLASLGVTDRIAFVTLPSL